MTTVDATEIARFSALARQWWDADGPMRPLHRMNPTRLTWLKQQVCTAFGRGEKDPKALQAYYKEVGSATELPLFVQAVGQMSVDTILQMYRDIPTLRYVKDEAGQPLARIQTFREKTSDELKIFTGSHGKTLIDEMMRGFSGSMPAASFADVYASAWDQWHAGKKKEAVSTFGDAAILINELSAYEDGMKYILYLRGVFKTYGLRHRNGTAPQNRFLVDDRGKQVLREMLDLMKPVLRA